MLVKEQTRKLARVVTIDSILPIPKADRLEVAVVGGWECVVQKNQFKVGDKAVYFEIDAAIAMNHPVLANFDKSYLKTTKDEHTNEDYAVIKTVRLRGALSQGLLLPLTHCLNSKENYLKEIVDFKPDTNITELLNVLKYVSPEEAKLYNMRSSEDRDANKNKKLIWHIREWLTRGIIADGLQPFPYGHVKSEEERVQNMAEAYSVMAKSDDTFEESIKLDGESSLFYVDLTTGVPGVAQRNYALRVDDLPYTKMESLRVYVADWLRFIGRRWAGATCPKPFWKDRYHAQSVPLVAFFHRNNMVEKLNQINSGKFALIEGMEFLDGRKIAVQGEMIGPDFHANAEKVPTNRFYVYRAYANGNIVLTPWQTRSVAAVMGLDYIPVVDHGIKLPEKIQDALLLADGPAVFNLNGLREGVVMKSNTTGKSFKIISNKWLEKKGK